jgi:predicted Zn-dependent protease
MRAIMLSVAQLDERIEKCLAILADNPHSQVFAALADAYRKRGEFGRAFAVCKSGLKHHPDYAPAHIVMAKLYLHQGMYEDSMASLKQAELQDGVTRASEHLEAEILIGMRKFDEASKLIERLRATDRGNPELKELIAQLKSARSAPSKPQRNPEPETERSFADADVTEQSNDAAEYAQVSWATWADDLSRRPHVLKAFAVKLSDSGTMPHSVLADCGVGYPNIDTVSVCSAMVAAVDADCRAKGVGMMEEIRIERPDGEVWCRRIGRRIVGFVGEKGISYGALRQVALDGVARVNDKDMDQ